MENQEIEDRVKKVVGTVLKIDPQTITTEANFVFDLGADSMQSVQLVGAFEEEFDIELEEDKALAVQTVGDAVTYVAQCVK
jgi:acyl carrier protein